MSPLIEKVKHPSTQEAEAGGIAVRSWPGLHSEFQASLCYKARPSLDKTKKGKEGKKDRRYTYGHSVSGFRLGFSKLLVHFVFSTVETLIKVAGIITEMTFLLNLHLGRMCKIF
jgi:hypothetical protein